jgi:hypothetical protein
VAKITHAAKPRKLVGDRSSVHRGVQGVGSRNTDSTPKSNIAMAAPHKNPAPKRRKRWRTRMPPTRQQTPWRNKARGAHRTTSVKYVVNAAHAKIAPHSTSRHAASSSPMDRWGRGSFCRGMGSLSCWRCIAQGTGNGANPPSEALVLPFLYLVGENKNTGETA